MAFETKDGKRVEGQAIGQKGKSTTVRLKGIIRGGISGVTVYGREELTNAEVASDSFVLRLLQGDVAFGTVKNGVNERRSAFIDMIWFTPPKHQFNRVSSTKQTFNQVNTPLIKKLNGSQKEVAHAMLLDSLPLVIAHGETSSDFIIRVAYSLLSQVLQEQERRQRSPRRSSTGSRNESLCG